jgi:hypothetical protein
MKRICTCLLIGAYLATSSYQAQAQYVPSAGINAIGMAMRQTLVSSGLAGSSAALLTAQAAVSKYLGSTVAKIAAGAVVGATTPNLMAIAGTLIVGSVLSAGFDWVMNSNGSVTINRPVSTSAAPAIVAGNLIWATAGNAGYHTAYVSTPTLLPEYVMANLKDPTYNTPYTGYRNCTFPSPTQYQCDFSAKDGNGNTQWRNQLYIGEQTTAPMSCPQGQIIKGGSCTTDTKMQQPTTTTNVPTTYPNIDAAGASLSPEELAKPVPPSAIAAITTAIGTRVQQDATYVGPAIPPTTITDVGVSGAPPMTVADALKPIAPPQGTYDPAITPPAPNPQNPSTYDPSKPVPVDPTKPAPINVNVDFGPDPGIGKPDIGLEPTPTAQMILNPILNMLPGFKNLQLNGPTGACPTATFSVMGHVYVMENHCTLLESNRSTIGSISMAGYGLLTIIIILGA